ncbi:hypothetical protein [Candidatus Phytoplasma oryzae]|nr:hypothetical protein PIE28_00315 [Candidatus Phytoplasma oryzae]
MNYIKKTDTFNNKKIFINSESEKKLKKSELKFDLSLVNDKNILIVEFINHDFLKTQQFDLITKKIISQEWKDNQFQKFDLETGCIVEELLPLQELHLVYSKDKGQLLNVLDVKQRKKFSSKTLIKKLTSLKLNDERYQYLDIWFKEREKNQNRIFEYYDEILTKIENINIKKIENTENIKNVDFSSDFIENQKESEKVYSDFSSDFVANKKESEEISSDVYSDFVENQKESETISSDVYSDFLEDQKESETISSDVYSDFLEDQKESEVISSFLEDFFSNLEYYIEENIDKKMQNNLNKKNRRKKYIYNPKNIYKPEFYKKKNKSFLSIIKKSKQKHLLKIFKGKGRIGLVLNLFLILSSLSV